MWLNEESQSAHFQKWRNVSGVKYRSDRRSARCVGLLFSSFATVYAYVLFGYDF